MKTAVLRDVVPYPLVVSCVQQSCEGQHCLHFQGGISRSQEKQADDGRGGLRVHSQPQLWFFPLSTRVTFTTLVVIFYPSNSDSNFLRNVRTYIRNYMASHPTQAVSSPWPVAGTCVNSNMMECKVFIVKLRSVFDRMSQDALRNQTSTGRCRNVGDGEVRPRYISTTEFQFPTRTALLSQSTRPVHCVPGLRRPERESGPLTSEVMGAWNYKGLLAVA